VSGAPRTKRKPAPSILASLLTLIGGLAGLTEIGATPIEAFAAAGPLAAAIALLVVTAQKAVASWRETSDDLLDAVGKTLRRLETLPAPGNPMALERIRAELEELRAEFERDRRARALEVETLRRIESALSGHDTRFADLVDAIRRAGVRVALPARSEPPTAAPSPQEIRAP